MSPLSKENPSILELFNYLSKYVHKYPPPETTQLPCLSYSLKLLTIKSLFFKIFFNPIPKNIEFFLLTILILHLIFYPIIQLIGVDSNADCQSVFVLKFLTTLPLTINPFAMSYLLQDVGLLYFNKLNILLILVVKAFNYSALNLLIDC